MSLDSLTRASWRRRAGHTGGMTSDASDRTVLYGISSRAWEHPADRGALVALRKLRGFDTVVKRLSSFITERAVRLMLLGSAVRVDSRQFSRLFRIYTEAATVLDVEQVPELYVAANPYLNAQTIGLDKPVIVVNSSLLYALDDDDGPSEAGSRARRVGRVRPPDFPLGDHHSTCPRAFRAAAWVNSSDAAGFSYRASRASVTPSSE